MSRNHRPLVMQGDVLESRFADAYRALRATLLAEAGERPLGSVLVASARSGEGRSTTVANLGIVIGQACGRAMLVDADFRNPSLQHLLPSVNGAGLKGAGVNGSAADHQRSAYQPPAMPIGLADVLRGSAELEEVILPTRFAGVWLVPAGRELERAGDMLGSPRLGEVLRALRQRWDVVLVDSPGWLSHVDAIELAAQAGGVLYVVRSGDQDPATQQRVQAQLRQARARLLGVVFNGA
jgi:Mrp family chromosome partitioning ATPase